AARDLGKERQGRQGKLLFADKVWVQQPSDLTRRLAHRPGLLGGPHQAGVQFLMLDAKRSRDLEFHVLPLQWTCAAGCASAGALQATATTSAVAAANRLRWVTMDLLAAMTRASID